MTILFFNIYLNFIFNNLRPNISVKKMYAKLNVRMISMGIKFYIPNTKSFRYVTKFYNPPNLDQFFQHLPFMQKYILITKKFVIFFQKFSLSKFFLY